MRDMTIQNINCISRFFLLVSLICSAMSCNQGQANFKMERGFLNKPKKIRSTEAYQSKLKKSAENSDQHSINSGLFSISRKGEETPNIKIPTCTNTKQNKRNSLEESKNFFASLGSNSNVIAINTDDDLSGIKDKVNIKRELPESEFENYKFFEKFRENADTFIANLQLLQMHLQNKQLNSALSTFSNTLYSNMFFLLKDNDLETDPILLYKKIYDEGNSQKYIKKFMIKKFLVDVYNLIDSMIKMEFAPEHSHYMEKICQWCINFYEMVIEFHIYNKEQLDRILMGEDIDENEKSEHSSIVSKYELRDLVSLEVLPTLTNATHFQKSGKSIAVSPRMSQKRSFSKGKAAYLSSLSKEKKFKGRDKSIISGEHQKDLTAKDKLKSLLNSIKFDKDVIKIKNRLIEILKHKKSNIDSIQNVLMTKEFPEIENTKQSKNGVIKIYLSNEEFVTTHPTHGNNAEISFEGELAKKIAEIRCKH